MIGVFPIGAVPVGSNQLAGLRIEELGQASASASTNSYQLFLKLLSQAGSSSASGFDLSTLTTLDAQLAELNAQALVVTGKLLPILVNAQALASANSTSGISISVTPLNISSDALDGQTLAKIDLGIGSSTISALSVIPKQISTMIFAHAIASGDLLNNLQIRLKVGRAESNVSAIDIDSLARIPIGIPYAQFDSLDVITKSILQSDAPSSTASSLDLENISIYLNLGQALAGAESLASRTNIYMQVGQAICEANGIDFSGLSIGMFKAEALSNARTFGMGIPLVTAGLSAASNDVTLLIKSDLLLASAQAQAYEFEPMLLNAIIGDLIASANNADVTYIVTGVPDIIVTRSSDLTQNVLKVLNEDAGNVNIYRASDHRGLFELIAQNQSPDEYLDSGIDEEFNYKYKAAFVITGTIGGQSVVVEGEKSLPIYTIGNKLL